MSISLINIIAFVLLLGLGVLAWVKTRALHISQSRLNTLFHHAPLAMIVLDENWRILEWNNQAHQMFQWREQEVIGQNIIELLTEPTDHKNIKRILSSVLKQKTAVRSENWNLTKDGESILCEWLNAPYSNLNGETKQIICMARAVEA